MVFWNVEKDRTIQDADIVLFMQFSYSYNMSMSFYGLKSVRYVRMPFHLTGNLYILVFVYYVMFQVFSIFTPKNQCRELSAFHTPRVKPLCESFDF